MLGCEKFEQRHARCDSEVKKTVMEKRKMVNQNLQSWTTESYEVLMKMKNKKEDIIMELKQIEKLKISLARSLIRIDRLISRCFWKEVMKVRKKDQEEGLSVQVKNGNMLIVMQ